MAEMITLGHRRSLACETTQEATMSTKTFGKPVLENSYTNVRMATVLMVAVKWLLYSLLR